jgi:hypothetical protein
MVRFIFASTMIAVVAGCGGAVDDSGAASEALSPEVEPGMSVLWQRGAMPSQVGTASPLIDHGGRVLPAGGTYAIWWGNQAAFPSDAKAGLDTFFQGLNGTGFLGIADQYMRGSKTTTGFVTNWSDSSSPPTHAPSTSTIVAEACKVLGANGQMPDSTAIYFVYTSNFPRHANFCAWHYYGACNGKIIQVAYMPNTKGIAGCDPGNLYACNSYSEGTRSLANVTSHEYMEAITDPDVSAWYDASGAEIGDKCAWQFSSCVSLSTGSWQLQEEWSNSASGCVQQ